MTNVELKAWMTRHSYTRSQVGELIGNSGKTVSQYLAGIKPVPQAVEFVLLYISGELPSDIETNETLFKSLGKDLYYSFKTKSFLSKQ